MTHAAAWACRRACLAIAMGLAALATQAAPQIEASEAGIKAAFLFRFATYIEWPATTFPSAAAPFVIGVMGNDEVARQLATLTKGRKLGSHPVSVRQLREGDSLKGVDLLFVGRTLADRLDRIAHAAQDAGVLVVSDADGGLEAGSTINFVAAGDRVAFEVSLDPAERSGHHISSRMLALARRVLPKAN